VPAGIQCDAFELRSLKHGVTCRGRARFNALDQTVFGALSVVDVMGRVGCIVTGEGERSTWSICLSWLKARALGVADKEKLFVWL